MVVIKATWTERLSEAPDKQRGCRSATDDPNELIPVGVVDHAEGSGEGGLHHDHNLRLKCPADHLAS